jgi:hypothetical protein
MGTLYKVLQKSSKNNPQKPGVCENGGGLRFEPGQWWSNGNDDESHESPPCL